jgi:hypothetical protein
MMPPVKNTVSCRAPSCPNDRTVPSPKLTYAVPSSSSNAVDSGPCRFAATFTACLRIEFGARLPSSLSKGEGSFHITGSRTLGVVRYNTAAIMPMTTGITTSMETIDELFCLSDAMHAQATLERVTELPGTLLPLSPTQFTRVCLVESAKTVCNATYLNA